MIFGKTYSERHREDQERLKELKGKWFYSFAWFPTEMSNGEWVDCRCYCTYPRRIEGIIK